MSLDLKPCWLMVVLNSSLSLTFCLVILSSVERQELRYSTIVVDLLTFPCRPTNFCFHVYHRHKIYCIIYLFPSLTKVKKSYLPECHFTHPHL